MKWQHCISIETKIKIPLLKLSAIVVLFASVQWAAADSGPTTTVPSVTGATLYTGTMNAGCSYPRVVRLQYSGAANGRLLATFENFQSKNFGIYESDDDGYTWTSSPIGICSEQKNGSGWSFKWEPFLFELPRALGNLAAGTL